MAVAVAIAISKAETLSRPLSGRDSVSRMDSHSSVEGLSGPLAVVATVVEARVETRNLLVRSAKAGVGLADGVLGGVLVAVDVVAVLKSGDGTVVSTGSTGVGLTDGVSRGQLMSVNVVAVLKGGGEGNSVTDAISVRSISAPLANTVSMGSVDSGAGAVAVAGGRPGGQAAGGELVAIEGFGGGGHG